MILILVYFILQLLPVLSQLRDEHEDPPFKLDFLVERFQPSPRLNKRQNAGEFSMNIQNLQIRYLAELQIGSNHETIKVAVDTGSSDLWVMQQDVNCTANRPSTCTNLGSFDHHYSNTFKQNKTAPGFQINYVDGSKAIGIWGHDEVMVGNQLIEDLSFAVVNETSSTIGILGIGYPQGQTTMKYGYSYENLPLKLRNQGIIQKNVYSVYMNSRDAIAGSLLFGAIDHAKYQGELITLNITNRKGGLARLMSMVDQFQISKSVYNNIPISIPPFEVLFDTGASYSFLPQQLVDSIGIALNGIKMDNGDYEINCGIDPSITLQIGFQGRWINIPVFDLLIRNTDGSCKLGIFPQERINGLAIFGDNILRSIYLVFDLEDHKIMLAPVNYTDKENIEIVGPASSIDEEEVEIKEDDSNSEKKESLGNRNQISNRLIYIALGLFIVNLI